MTAIDRKIPMYTATGPAGRPMEHVWSLSVEEAFLKGFFEDLFGNHYAALTFGPIIEGGAYELRVPGKPDKISFGGGYLTVHWGAKGHFHLCLGTNYGPSKSPNSPELIAQRRPLRAEFFRKLDKDGHPVSWGFRMFNGHMEQTITIFLPNPFLTDADGIAKEPDWTRLALWDELLKTYAGHQPDGLDRLGKGFGGAG